MLLKFKFQFSLPENKCMTFVAQGKKSPFYNSDLMHFAHKADKEIFPCVATLLGMGADSILPKPSED